MLTFGDDIQKLSSFSNEEEKLIQSLGKLKISGNSNLSDGIAFSLQILVEEMRKLGGKNNRIFIITDSNPLYNERMQKLVNIAKGLGVFIDICQFGIAETGSGNLWSASCPLPRRRQRGRIDIVPTHRWSGCPRHSRGGARFRRRR